MLRSACYLMGFTQTHSFVTQYEYIQAFLKGNFTLKTDREDRIKRPLHRVWLPEIDTGKGLIIAAVIIVLGSFTSKLIYDYIQEQRLLRAINQAVLYMDNAVKQSESEAKQAQEIGKQQRQAQQVFRLQQQKQQRIDAINNAVQIKKDQLSATKRSSKECQFWSLQHKNNPSSRTHEKTSEFCGFVNWSPESKL